ncbi:MAG: hypothetical protein CSA74_05195 [Rhodobacterales bacterium]|nr:MAG: hypothetical protein CSA74_05195 [Rhodobacterales bacterium]
MKKFVLGAAFALVASTAVAGSVAPPVIQDVVIVNESTSSVDHSFLPPVFFLISVLATAAVL